MKLKEFVDDYRDKFLYVGAQTGWFYCGIADDIRPYAKKFDEENIIRSERAIKRLTDELAVANKHIPKYEETIQKYNDELLRTGDPDKIRYLQEEIKDYTSKLEYCKGLTVTNPEMIQRYNEYIANYVKAMEREVVSVYDTTFKEPSGMNVIVEGTEVSRFWDYEEYLASINEPEVLYGD